MLHRFVLHNDEIRESGERLFTAGQVGLFSGWGVFSTLRITGSVPFAFDRHWARMAADAAAFHVTLPPDSGRVLRRLHDLVEANRAHEAAMRLMVVRNHGGMWAGPGNGRPSDLIALTAAAKEWGRGARLTYASQARHAACRFAGAKILSWAMNLTFLEDAQAAGFDEVILLNERGEVSECTSANIFAVEGGRVWTPPLESGCLPGVTRAVLMSEIRAPGLELGEKTLFPADLEAADEVFITSTTRNLLPVLSIDGRATPEHRPVTAALLEAFNGYVEGYVARHRESRQARQ